MTPRQRLQQIMALVLAPGVLIVFALGLLALQRFYLVDDAYISFRYAKNLAAGHGLVWNPGEMVEGYTNLLWVLLLTPFARLGWDLSTIAVSFSLMASCATLELMRRIAARALPDRSPLLHAAPALLLALNPSFAYWAAQGMESPLFTLLVLLAVSKLVGRRAEGERGRWQVATLLALAYLTRPEGALIGAIVLLVELLWGRGTFRARFGRLFRIGLGVLVVVAAHMLIRYHFYGELFPNTFYAKVILGQVALARGLRHLWAFLLAGGALALVGLPALRSAAEPRPALASLWRQGYVLFGVYASYLLLIGGDIPPWNRFYLPLLPLPLIASVVVIARLIARPSEPRRRRRRLAAALALGLLGTSLATARGLAAAEPATAPFVGFAQAAMKWLTDAFLAKLPRHSYLAIDGVGLIGYYSEKRILDVLGLNDHHIAHTRVRADPRRRFAHDKTDWYYVLTQRPDLIIILRGQLPEPLVGYDICWPTHLLGLTVVYRRRDPLKPSERTLGMPPGALRHVEPPPPCLLPRIPHGAKKAGPRPTARAPRRGRSRRRGPTPPSPSRPRARPA